VGSDAIKRTCSEAILDRRIVDWFIVNFDDAEVDSRNYLLYFLAHHSRYVALAHKLIPGTRLSINEPFKTTFSVTSY